MRLRIVTPSGEVIEHDEADLEQPVELGDTSVPGVYRVQVATRESALHEAPRLAFLVAPPADESDLTPAPLPEAARSDGSGSGVNGVVERPLAPWLFLLVGLLAVAEALLRLRAGHLARRPA